MEIIPVQGIDQVKLLDEQAAKLAIQKQLTIQKALTSGNVDEIYKAQQYYQELISRQRSQIAGLQGATGNNKSLLFDPMENSASMGYYDKVTTSLSFDGLRTMSKAPIIRAIIDTRKEQVSEYTKPQPDKYSKGFVIREVKTAGSDSTQNEPSSASKKVVEELTNFILNCGDDDNKWDLDDFETFVRKIVEDSLTLDQATFEVVTDRSRKPIQMIATDGATFRLADSYDNNNNTASTPKVNGYFPSYVQIYQNNIAAEFYPWELCFGIRNPTTNIYANGYGRSELEVLIQTVTSMLNADAYNSKFFRNGSAPKGALLVKGTTNPDRLAEFRREWNATMAGVENHHKTPILEADKFEWLDLQKTNRDMEFSAYQQYLIKLACAIYKISPEEIGFPLEGDSGGGLNSDSGKEEKDYSKDKGLKPLLRSIQTWLNKYIIGPKTDWKYEFVFMGLDAETSESEEERLNKAATVYMTINEVRKIRGLDPIPGGDVILNPVYLQSAQAEAQAHMAEQQPQDTNPFSSGDDSSFGDNNPFAKSLDEFWEKTMIVKQ